MNKRKKALKLIPAIIVSLFMVMSASMKLSGVEELTSHYAEIGVLQYIKLLAVVELILVALYLNPKTMKAGFILLTAYFGGAIATELSHGSSMILPMIVLILIWGATYARDKSIFKATKKKLIFSSFDTVF